MGTLAMPTKIDGKFLSKSPLINLFSCFCFFFFIYELSCVLITALITNKQIHIYDHHKKLILLLNVFKQFVVTNCSKERPGSTVTETLTIGVLIPIVTSKESNFKAKFKYINFIKFSLTHQKLRD